MESSQIVRRVWQELEPELEEQGFELVEVEFGQHGGPFSLCLYVDKEGGVTLDDCQAVSQLVSPLLDAGDFVRGRYMLEVSSPGIDRPIRRPKDFERFVGENVVITALVPVDGRKRFKGTLRAFRDGLVSVECDGRTVELHVENLKKAKLDR